MVSPCNARPSACLATSIASACAAPAGSTIVPLSLPLICTASVTSSTVSSAGSADQEIAYLHIVPASDGGIVADGGFDVSTGTITLTYSNENQIAGSFDALFDDPNTGNPSELQGTFNVAYCP